MIKIIFNLGLSGSIMAALLGCSDGTTNSQTSEPKSAEIIESGKVGPVRPQKSVSETLVYMSFKIEKSSDVINGWTIHDIDDHIQQIHLNSRDPRFIVEFAFEGPLLNPTYHTSKKVSLQALSELEKADSSVSLKENEDRYTLVVKTELEKSTFDRWAFVSPQNDGNNNNRIWKMPLFTIDEIIENTITEDRKSKLAKTCFQKNQITDARFYMAQARLNPTEYSPFKDQEVIANISVCEGLYRNSQNLLYHNGTIIGFIE